MNWWEVYDELYNATFIVKLDIHPISSFNDYASMSAMKPVKCVLPEKKIGNELMG